MRCEGLGRGATDRLLILNDFTLVLLFVTGGSLKQHLQAAQAVQLLHDVSNHKEVCFISQHSFKYGGDHGRQAVT